MRRRSWPILGLLLACALGARSAAAQSAAEPPALRAHRVTASGGLVWSGGYPIGDITATLRGNTVGASAPPYILFEADTSVEAVAGVEARIGFALTSSLAIEGGVAFQRPRLSTTLSRDPEITSTTIDAERLSQYIIDIAGVWHLPGLRLGRRARPFVTGGGGYLRQLYDERTLVETGSVYYGGGGLRYWFRGGDGIRRAVGLQAQARAQWRRGGVEFADETRVMPVVTAHLFVEF